LLGCGESVRIRDRDGEVAMKGSKSVGLAVLVLGVAVLLLSAMADVFGLGGSPLVFGYKQFAGAAVGSALAIAGAVLYWWFGRQE